MGYTLSLHLKEEAPIDEIISFLENSPTVKENPSIRVTSNPDEHGYARKSPNGCGIYISYSIINTVESYLIHALIYFTAVQYGLRTKHHKLRKNVPYYMYDDAVIFVLSENELSRLSPSQYQYKTFNDIVVKDVYNETTDEYEDQDGRVFQYYETSKYNESSKKDDLLLSLKVIKFLSGEFKRLKIAENEFKSIKSTLLDKYPSTTKITENY
jgi:hypothetical protein